MAQPAKRLTDAQLRAWLDHRPTDRRNIKDGAIPGLALRLGLSMMTFTLLLRVKGEGGVSDRGQKKNEKLQLVTLGEYPAITLEAARGVAGTYLDQARRGISPVKALEAAATAGGLTVTQRPTGLWPIAHNPSSLPYTQWIHGRKRQSGKCAEDGRMRNRTDLHPEDMELVISLQHAPESALASPPSQV